MNEYSYSNGETTFISDEIAEIYLKNEFTDSDLYKAECVEIDYLLHCWEVEDSIKN